MGRLLDSSVCVDLLRGRDPSINARFKAGVGSIFMSSVTYCELRTGALRSARPRHHEARLLDFVESVPIQDFSAAAAAAAAAVRAALMAAGRIVGELDMLIAGHTLALGWTLVTSDRDYSRIEGLCFEDWRLSPAP